MRKRFVKAMFFGTLALTTATFVGCKDYDDDINSLQEQVNANKASIADLQKFVKEGKWVKEVASIEGGFRITFNDGNTYDIVNGAKGDKGDDGLKGDTGNDGAPGAPGSVVTMDEATGHWFIDGKDTGVSYKGTKGDKGDAGDKGDKGDNGDKGDKGDNGLNGRSPRISADGYWEIFDDEKGDYVPTDIKAGKDCPYIVQLEDRPGYVLHMFVDGEWKELLLPNAEAISSLKPVSIGENNKIETAGKSCVTVNLLFGKATKDIKLKNEYKKGEVITAEAANLYALINPVNIDFSKTAYSFKLKNSQDVANYEIASIEPYKTESPLTRAAVEPAWNRGVYKMCIDVKDKKGTAPKDFNSQALALSTTDAWGNEIISDYDVKVVAKNVAADFVALTDGTANANIGKEYNLDELAKAAGIEFAQVVEHLYEVESAEGVSFDAEKQTIQSATGREVKVTLKYVGIDGKLYDGSEGNEKPVTLTIKFAEVRTVNLGTINKDWNGKDAQSIALDEKQMDAVKAEVGDGYATLDTEKFTSTGDVNFTVDGTKENALTLNIAKGTAGDKNEAKLTIKVDNEVTVEVVANVVITYPDWNTVLTGDAAPAYSSWWYDDKTHIQPSYVIENGKMDVAIDGTQMFSNLDKMKAAAEEIGAEIVFMYNEELKDGKPVVSGVSFDASTNKLTFAVGTYKHTAEPVNLSVYLKRGDNKERIAEGTAKFAKAMMGEYTEKKDGDEAYTIALTREANAVTMSGMSWMDAQKERDALMPTPAGTWSGKTMQEAMNANGLHVEFKVEGAKEYFTVDQAKGTVAVSDATKNMVSNAETRTIKVTPVVTNDWGFATVTLKPYTVTLAPWGM